MPLVCGSGNHDGGAATLAHPPELRRQPLATANNEHLNFNNNNKKNFSNYGIRFRNNLLLRIPINGQHSENEHKHILHK